MKFSLERTSLSQVSVSRGKRLSTIVTFYFSLRIKSKINPFFDKSYS